MKIILVRHGLTEANMSKHYSKDDAKIHESGLLVLENTKKNLKKYNIDEIYTSNLLRSQQTAEKLGYNDYIKDKRLNEMNFGNFKGQYIEDIKKTQRDFFIKEKESYFDIKYPDGESRQDVLSRTGEFLEEIIKKDKNILCISHGIAIRACIFWILKDLSNWNSFWIDNGSLTVFDIDRNRRLIESVNIL